MKTVGRTFAVLAALSFAAAVPSYSAAAVPGMQEQQHRDQGQVQQHEDYSKNQFYRIGNREGYEDYRNKTQRKEHNHKYTNDYDRRAHDTGYQEGLQGRQYNQNQQNQRPR